MHMLMKSSILVRQHTKKEYLYMNQKTYIPVSILPFTNSEIGRLFLVKGKIVNTLDVVSHLYFIFIWNRWQAGFAVWPPLFLQNFWWATASVGCVSQETEVNNTSHFNSFSILLCKSKPVFTFYHILDASFSYHVESRVKAIQVKWHEIRNSSFMFPSVWISIAL